ncbi:hypothetical protein ACVIIW_006868 [Bradyrhizobium sp. USDA 4449]
MCSSDAIIRSASGKSESGLAALVLCYTAICCISLVFVSKWYPSFHILFDEQSALQAALTVSLLAFMSFFFGSSQFSFGYFVSFYLYSLLIGYIWLSYFSRFEYDLVLARFSAVASFLALAVPSVLINAPLPQVYRLSTRAFNRLPIAIMFLALAVIGIGATQGFRLVGLEGMYSARQDITHPAWLNYFILCTSTTLLPFAFACFVERRARWKAAACLLLACLFYPISLNKMTLLTPAWLLFMTALTASFKPRTAVILSLLIPISTGVLFFLSLDRYALTVFGTVNFRMLAIPSSILDIYNDFFSKHALTYFCQISVLKFSDCPYQEQLGVILANEYHLGNLNGSLFATEGVASVGLLFAPATAFMCGLVLTLLNGASAGLRPSFILTSSAILPTVFMNVPLSTILVSYGGAALFLLWYVCPRDSTTLLSR